MIGALAGAGVAFALPDAPGFVAIPLMIAAGFVGGMVWAGIPAVLKTRFRVSEVLVDPDAGLCRVSGAELPDRRSLEGPERAQLPADAAAPGR